MRFLPIVERELRVAARQASSYWMRLGAALAALLIVGWILLMTEFRAPQRIGLALFVPLSILAFLYSLFFTGLRTTDCLSEEKREGTLGLLFLTDLKGYDVVFGKLAATSLNAFYGLLAIFPVLAIPLLAGGVSGAEFGRVTLACLNNAFLSLAVGMLCSAVSTDDRRAVVATLLILLGLTGGLPLLGVLATNWPDPDAQTVHPVFLLPSPGYYSFFAFDQTFKGLKEPRLFYLSVACAHALGWLCLGLASYLVPRSWQDTESSPAAQRRREWRRRWVFGGPAARAALRRRLLEINPFYWLASRECINPKLVWGFVALGAAVWAWGLAVHPRDWKHQEAYVLTGLAAHGVLKVWLTLEACRRFSIDRRSGALELLLSTPLSVLEMVRGQAAALFKQFAGPVGVVLLADFVFLTAESHEEDWVLTWAAGMIVFVADLITLGVVSMWLGLCSRSAARAALEAMAGVLVLPWVLFVALLALLFYNGMIDRFVSSQREEEFILLAWVGIGLGVDLWFGVRSWRNLRSEFRAVATQRSEQPGKRRRWWGKPAPA